ncbi:TPA: hypothetical protein EYP66_14675 [Candidatus Poribacteria bacterium]|nr:hypothetical protein [Candidatus Poribacteria bacterium]
MNKKPYKKLHKVLAIVSLVCGGLSIPVVILAGLPDFFRFSFLRTLTQSGEMAIRLETPLMLLPIPLALIAIICGYLSYRGMRAGKLDRSKILVLGGIVLGCISMFLAFTPVVDKVACSFWRSLNPANYEIVLKLEGVSGKKITSADLTKAVSVLLKRLRGWGQFYQPESVSPDRIIIKLSTKSKKGIDGLRQVGGYLTFRLVHQENESLVKQMHPPDFQPPIGYEKMVLDNEWYFVRTIPELTGARITKAEVKFDKVLNHYFVALNFDQEGSKILSRVTADNVNRRLAIVLDGKLISAPVIRGRLYGGRVQIEGDFTPIEAHELASALRHGGLPCQIRIVREKFLE